MANLLLSLLHDLATLSFEIARHLEPFLFVSRTLVEQGTLEGGHSGTHSGRLLLSINDGSLTGRPCVGGGGFNSHPHAAVQLRLVALLEVLGGGGRVLGGTRLGSEHISSSLV
jgi:hypothetical protein